MNEPINILIVDDEKNIRVSLRDFLKANGYDAECASSAQEALALFEKERFDVVITDYKMPGQDGYELSRTLLKKTPGLIVIIMTAFGSIQDAVSTIKHGIYDYITKPLDTGHLLKKLESVRKDIFSSSTPLSEDGAAHSMFSLKSGANLEVLDLVKKCSATSSTVLLTGETGTGKTEVARMIHSLSQRKKNPFIYMNCAAISPNLMESELFGHVKGAFTGADRPRSGKILQADRGTLFLDEIGSTSVEFQSKLLGVLQDKFFEHVGDDKPIKVDVRFIAATNVDLDEAMRNKQFRQDLYYRLKVFAISMPALRDRKEDIVPLAEQFMQEAASERNLVLSEAAKEKLLSYSWPGNIRELKNIVVAATDLCEGSVIEPKHVLIRNDFQNVSSTPQDGKLKDAVNVAEKDMILSALEKTGGSMTEAAALLEIHERSLRRKIRFYGIDRKDFIIKNKS